ncbi:MAG: ribonuclease E/G [Schleiferiaceae bacterium]|nr:ribonuclease E/G [Schleiferiaceae bacterium]MDR9441628.1 ribonuclease E/G [Schleiferiaceae bacterium]
MSTELVINSRTADQVAVALLKDGKLSELHYDNSDEFAVGDIYLGKIKKVVPGLNAAFVDVGYEKDAFLHYHDLGPQIRSLNKFTKRTLTGKQRWSLSDFSSEKDIDKNGSIKDVLKSGQSQLVQIAKEPISTKGPRITSELSLAGRYIVLVPFSDRVSVSSRLRDKEEKDRLRRLINSIRPKGFGIIVRTAAEDCSVADLDSDLQELVQKWKQMHRTMQRAKPPTRVLTELNRVSTLLRDVLNDSFSSIAVDEKDLFEEIKSYMHSIQPDMEKIVKYYEGRLPIFEHFGVERQIKGSFGRTVNMGKGAYLIIEHTEAMHVIDVNSGNRTNSNENQESNALSVNMAAAEEIARQLRLRDMGGIIVVDFIDLHKSDNRKKLHEKLKQEMSRDRAKHKILPPSRFGLVEITRQRVRPEMYIQTREKNPDGQGEVEAPILIVEEIESRLELIAKQDKEKSLYLHCHPFIAAYITKGLFKSLRRQWARKYRRNLKVIPRDSYKFLEYDFFNSKDERYEFEG